MGKRAQLKKKKRRGTVIRVTGVFFLLGAITVWMVISHYMTESEALDLSELEDPLPEPTEIYDADGELITELQAHNFTSVPLSEIPDILVQAVIAVEDERFYEHSGFDYRAIGRSAWRNILAGGISEGGSTITQQLAKNLYFSAERTFDRKIREVFAASRIENEFDKDDIMELYLNQIYFGEGTWGVQDAAQKYFGKDVQDIELEEAALLAALPRSPSFYSPYQNEEEAEERRNLVLSMMHDQEYIDENEFNEAVAEPIVVAEETNEGPGNNYPAYIEFVLDEAVQVYGLTVDEIYEEGLQIHTQMDPQVQQSIEDAFENNELFPENEGDELVQSASVVIDPETGGIKGLKGYRGEHVARGFNRASQLRRSPGSTIKPLSVFAPAMEEGFSPEDELEDEEMEFGEYVPTNSDNEFVGELTVREALVTSRNVPAVALLDEIGVEKGYEFLKQAKLPVEEEEKHNLSIALGGMTNGVSPLEMAQAYTMFPNQGNMTEAFAITRITDRNGEVIVERETEEVEIMDPVNAYAVTDMLIEAVDEGTGFRAQLDGWDVAGKTGTAQLPDTEAFEGAEGVHDAWFVGYTPELVASVWIGFDNPGGENVLDTFGGKHPAKVFQAIMEEAHKGMSETEFVIPDGYEERHEEEEDDGEDGANGSGSEDADREDDDDNGNESRESSGDNDDVGENGSENNGENNSSDNSQDEADNDTTDNNAGESGASENNEENNDSTDENEDNSSEGGNDSEENNNNGSSENGGEESGSNSNNEGNENDESGDETSENGNDEESGSDNNEGNEENSEDVNQGSENNTANNNSNSEANRSEEEQPEQSDNNGDDNNNSGSDSTEENSTTNESNGNESIDEENSGSNNNEVNNIA